MSRGNQLHRLYGRTAALGGTILIVSTAVAWALAGTAAAAGTSAQPAGAVAAPNQWDAPGNALGAANDGAPNIMFVVTDGSPNKPNTNRDNLFDPETWLAAANAAIAAADNARAAGSIVKAVYLTTAGDPGDTSMPFSAAGDSAWAERVMAGIGGGDSFLSADFTGFTGDLFRAIQCPEPTPSPTPTPVPTPTPSPTPTPTPSPTPTPTPALRRRRRR